MHVGIDGLHLFGDYSGVQYALTRTLEQLCKRYASDKFTLFTPKDFDDPPALDENNALEFENLKVRRTWFPGKWRGVRTLWRNFRLQAHAYQAQCELLHGPTYALPAMLSIPSVVTIHDTIALSHPQFCTPGSAKVQKRTLPRSARVARRILVPTEFVKHELERLVQVEPDRIDVVPWGVGAPFRPVAEQDKLDDARGRWRLPEHFVLYVGNLEPKKNIEDLIKAFFAAKAHRKLPHSLVLVGRMGWGMTGLDKLVRDHDAGNYVIFSGYVPESALPLMYNLADLLVLPSHVEGFGMPVLEAMACGCPVVISDAPALREVAGGAAQVVESGKKKSLEAFRELLEEILGGNGTLRLALREKGLIRASQFTWERTAELTRASYFKALGG